MPNLILTRRPGETIVINNNIRITIGAIQGSHVKLLIDAPLEIEVHREEIWKRIHCSEEDPEQAAIMRLQRIP